MKRLRGKPNTSVTIWVRREGEEELLKLDLTREIIKIKSVRYEMLSDDIGYLRLTQFKQKTDVEAAEAVKDMMNKGAKGLILDLRNNGGGLLNVCVNVSSMFLKGGPVVGTRGRVDKSNEEYTADPDKFRDTTNAVANITTALENSYTRWGELSDEIEKVKTKLGIEA